jgi:hypothetical protein
MAEPNPPNPQVRFSLAPGRLDADVIDYSTKAGKKFWKSSTEPLDQKFDGSAETVDGFLEQVKATVFERGWESINEIQEDGYAFIFWIDRYAEYSIERLRAAAAQYVNAQGRGAQDSFAMYTFLYKSLDTKFFQRVSHHKDKYTINGRGVGPLFLKTILTVVHHDLASLGPLIRKQIVALPQYIGTVGYNIDKFNEHVTELLNKLEARGEPEERETIINSLFEAYAMVPDKQFLGYLERKRDPFDEGTVKYNPRELMDLVLAKYTTLVMKEEWLKFAPTDAEQVTALHAKVDAIDKRTMKFEDKKQKGKPKAQNDKGKGKRDKGKKDGKGKDAWKTRKTADKITRDGKTYFWCPHHGAYGLHKPNDCRLGKQQQQQQQQQQADKKNDAPKSELNDAARSALALVHQDDDYE